MLGLPGGVEPLDFALTSKIPGSHASRINSPGVSRAWVGGSNKRKGRRNRRPIYYGAARRSRTADLFLTKEALCLLS